jgi:hypothetical protein
MLEPISLTYDFSHVLAADHDQHADTCIYHQIKQLQEVYRPFGGYPSTYTPENTILHQLWWGPDQLNYTDLGRQLGMEVISVSSIRQDPGHIIPYHRDMFQKINERYPERTEKRVRANIFLEHSKLGHIMQFTKNQRHETVSDWLANTGYMFDQEILHLSCNAGIEPKFTLQISGLYLD